MRYTHAQSVPLLLLLLSLAFLTGGWLILIFIVQYALYAAAVLTFLVLLSFGTLPIGNAGDWLQVEFGPLPIFRRKVNYHKIKSVIKSRTT